MLGQKLFVRDQLLLLWFLIHFSMEQSRKQLPISTMTVSLSLCHPYLFFLFCLFLLSLIYILLFNKTSYILIKNDRASWGNLEGTHHIDIGATWN